MYRSRRNAAVTVPSPGIATIAGSSAGPLVLWPSSRGRASLASVTFAPRLIARHRLPAAFKNKSRPRFASPLRPRIIAGSTDSPSRFDRRDSGRKRSNKPRMGGGVSAVAVLTMRCCSMGGSVSSSSAVSNSKAPLVDASSSPTADSSVCSLARIVAWSCRNFCTAGDVS